MVTPPAAESPWLPPVLATVLAALALLSAGYAGAARAQAMLERWDWDPAIRVAGEPVTFPSHSPFTPADVGDGPRDDPPEEAVGMLFLPPEASAGAPVPAVIMLHGASGVIARRELTYGRQLAAMGVAALVVDAFAARRDMAQGFTNRLIRITESMLVADAYAALRHLSRRPDIDRTRIALVGFSYGGMAATYALYRQVAERFAPDGPRFAGHVAFYAPCLARFTDPRTTGAPLLMLSGSRDEITDQRRCTEIAQELRAGGSEVKQIVYPDAVHQWDGSIVGPRRIGRTLSECDFTVREDGTVRDDNTGLIMRGPFSRRIILAFCVGREGYLIGRDDRVRERSNRDLGHFLARVFDRIASAD
jgi:dienelactone hydrolase